MGRTREWGRDDGPGRSTGLGGVAGVTTGEKGTSTSEPGLWEETVKCVLGLVLGRAFWWKSGPTRPLVLSRGIEGWGLRERSRPHVSVTPPVVGPRRPVARPAGSRGWAVRRGRHPGVSSGNGVWRTPGGPTVVLIQEIAGRVGSGRRDGGGLTGGRNRGSRGLAGRFRGALPLRLGRRKGAPPGAHRPPVGSSGPVTTVLWPWVSLRRSALFVGPAEGS